MKELKEPGDILKLLAKLEKDINFFLKIANLGLKILKTDDAENVVIILR